MKRKCSQCKCMHHNVFGNYFGLPYYCTMIIGKSNTIMVSDEHIRQNKLDGIIFSLNNDGECCFWEPKK